MFQSGAGCTIQLNFRLLINGHGRHQIQLRQRQIALRGQGLVVDPAPRSCSFFMISNVRCARSRALRAASTRAAGCSQRILRVAYFDADLFLQLLACATRPGGIPVRNGTGRPCDAVPDRNVQVESDVIVRRRVVEGILQGPGEIRRDTLTRFGP